MANDFINKQAVGVTTVTTVYTAPAAKKAIMLELDVANTTSATVTADVQLTDTSATTPAYIVKAAPISPGGTLQVIGGQKIVLEGTDLIKVTASGAVDVVCSILEDV